MVMAFIAPVASQALAARHSHEHYGMVQHMASHHAVPRALSHANEQHWTYVFEQCGYCNLLFSNPPLSSEFITRLASTPSNSELYQGLIAPGFARLPLFLGAMTRAPPRDA
jgi:hypothetical protein